MLYLPLKLLIKDSNTIMSPWAKPLPTMINSDSLTRSTWEERDISVILRGFLSSSLSGCVESIGVEEDFLQLYRLKVRPSPVTAVLCKNVLRVKVFVFFIF